MLFRSQLRVKFIKLLYLAERAPAAIAVPRVTQVRIADRRETACQIIARRQLVGKRFILDEAMLASRLNGVLIQMHRIGVSPFDAGDLGRHDSVLVGESRRT